MDVLQRIIGNISKESVQNILQIYYQIMGVPVRIVDNYGEIVCDVNCDQEPKSPCYFIKEEFRSFRLCQICFKSAFNEAFRWGETYISPCHAGLYQMSVPIIYNEDIIGGLIVCPFLMREKCAHSLKRGIKANTYIRATE